MCNKEFLSKKFICKLNSISEPVSINKIVKFIKKIDGKVEVENSSGNKADASSYLKFMVLGIKFDSEITFYCYGENKENNLKEIENYLYTINIYTEEKINELYNTENKNEILLIIEKEILSYAENLSDEKKEIIKNNIKEKANILNNKRDEYLLLFYSKFDAYNNSISYIENNNKSCIYNFCKNDIFDFIKQLILFYEIEFDIKELNDFIENLIKIINLKDIKYFYINAFLNNVINYFNDQFDSLFIKKLIDDLDLDHYELEYNIDFINYYIDNSIKNFEDVLKDKRNLSDSYLFHFRAIFKGFIDINIINDMIKNTGSIYEIDYFNLENILYKLQKTNEIIKFSNYNIEIIDTLQNYLQKEFENYYITKIISKDFNNNYGLEADIDYLYIDSLLKNYII